MRNIITTSVPNAMRLNNHNLLSCKFSQERATVSAKVALVVSPFHERRLLTEFIHFWANRNDFVPRVMCQTMLCQLFVIVTNDDPTLGVHEWVWRLDCKWGFEMVRDDCDTF